MTNTFKPGETVRHHLFSDDRGTVTTVDANAYVTVRLRDGSLMGAPSKRWEADPDCQSTVALPVHERSTVEE